MAVVGVVAMRQRDDVPRHVRQVEDGREGVEAGGVELVAVPHGQLAKALKVPVTDVLHHLGQALGDHHLCPVLPRHRGHHRATSVTPRWVVVTPQQ